MEKALDPSLTKNTQKISIKRIAAGSLFSLVSAASFSLLVPLILFFGVLSFFGFKTIHVNFHPVVGLQGFLTSLVMAATFPLAFSIFVWITLYLGICIWGSLGSITVSYVPANGKSSEAG
jgi:hypothetical protein